MKRLIVFAMSCVLGPAASLHAQAVQESAARQSAAAPAVALTLDDAIERGLETSHKLAEAAARERAARATVTVRDRADRPVVSLQGGYSRTNHVTEFGVRSPNGSLQVIYPDVPDNYRSRLDLQWPIYTGGRTSALVDAAAAEADAVGRDLESARADLRLEIARAYWANLTALDTVRVVEEALARVEAQLADVRNRLDVGLLSPADVLTVEAQRSRQRMMLIDAQNQRELAAADLRRLTGLAPDTSLDLTSSLAVPPPPPPPLDAQVREARGQRPERQALERRIGSAESRTRAAAAGRRPIVALAGGYDYARPNPRIFPREERWRDSWDVGVNVSWPLWDGGRVDAEVAEATANATAASERLAEFDAVLDLEVRQRRLDLLARLASIDAANDGVRSAAEARRVMSERFAAGVATSTELLDAQVTLLSAELDRTRALADARLAEARLARALGR